MLERLEVSILSLLSKLGCFDTTKPISAALSIGSIMDVKPGQIWREKPLLADNTFSSGERLITSVDGVYVSYLFKGVLLARPITLFLDNCFLVQDVV